jgi:branched-chain amino acid transport system ATP-binding protein
MTLRLDRVNCYHGEVHVLRDVSFQVAAGEVVGLLGRNGAGKTTTLRTIMGLVRARSGSISLGAEELTRLPPDEIPRRGVAYVPQGRRLFPDLTVAENLRMGLWVRDAAEETLEPVLDLFPVLRERLRQRAGTLSGGEQQMLATARALCARPTLLLMDEPSEGLMPRLIDRLLDTVAALRARGVASCHEQKVDAVPRGGPVAVGDRRVVRATPGPAGRRAGGAPAPRRRAPLDLRRPRRARRRRPRSSRRGCSASPQRLDCNRCAWRSCRRAPCSWTQDPAKVSRVTACRLPPAPASPARSPADPGPACWPWVRANSTRRSRRPSRFSATSVARS